MPFYSGNSYRAICIKPSEIKWGYHIYPFLISLVLMGGIFGLVYYLKNLNLKYDELKKNHMKNIRFKRNFQLFKRELEAEEPISFENPKELFL